MNWTTETLRSGIAFDVASDDFGTLGVPGTWHRVRQGSEILRTTRNRGDALRLFQRQVSLTRGACPTCFRTGGHHVQCPKFLAD